MQVCDLTSRKSLVLSGRHSPVPPHHRSPHIAQSQHFAGEEKAALGRQLSRPPVRRLSQKAELCLPEFLSGSRFILHTMALKACSYLAVPRVTLMTGSEPETLAEPKLAPRFTLAFRDFSPRTLSLRKFFTHSLGTG